MEEKERQLQEAIESYQAEIKCTMGKEALEKNDIVLKLDLKEVRKSTRADEIMDNVTCWASWYLFKRVKDAFRQISWYDPDSVVDDIWRGIGKITVKLCEEPENSDKKESEVKKWKGDKCGKLILKLPLLVRGYNMCFEESDLVSLIRVAAYQYQPEKKIDLLKSVAMEWRVHWGSLWNFLRVLNTEHLYWEPKDDKGKEAISKAVANVDKSREELLKAFQCKVVRKSGFRQEGVLVVTTKRYLTFGMNGDNMTEHEFDKHICVDLLPSKSKVPTMGGEYSLRIYGTEPPPEDPLKGCAKMCKCKPPKLNVKLPTVNLPSVSLPSIPMPSIPKVELPSVPAMPEMFKIDISNPFKREKKVRPPRFHPDVKEAMFTCILPADGTDKDLKKPVLEEIAWVVFAGQSCARRSTDYEPFYEDYPGSENPKASQDVPFPGSSCSMM